MSMDEEMKKIFTDSKKEIWKILMKDEPMPDSSPNAVEEFSEELKEIIGEIKDGNNPLLDILYRMRRGSL
jgi:hypothetical protein